MTHFKPAWQGKRYEIGSFDWGYDNQMPEGDVWDRPTRYTFSKKIPNNGNLHSDQEYKRLMKVEIWGELLRICLRENSAVTQTPTYGKGWESLPFLLSPVRGASRTSLWESDVCSWQVKGTGHRFHLRKLEHFSGCRVDLNWRVIERPQIKDTWILRTRCEICSWDMIWGHYKRDLDLEDGFLGHRNPVVVAGPCTVEAEVKRELAAANWWRGTVHIAE